MIKKSYNINIQGEKFSISTYYHKAGEDLLFCIHGLGCTKESFINIERIDNLKKFSQLIIDLPGFGDSSRSSNFYYSMEDHAEICKLLLAKFPQNRIHILGHSMGGAVGLVLSGLIPKKAKSFISVEGNLIRDDCSIMSRRTVAITLKEFKKHFFEKIRNQFKFSENKSFRKWAELSEYADPESFYRSSFSLVEWSDSGKLLKIFNDLKIPKLYIYGDQNSDLPVLKQLGNIEKIKISNSGHFIMDDNPDELFNKVSTFINEIK